MKIKKLYYGAAFYPELWDAATLERDIYLMKEAGINVVRMGEFSWSVLETHEDDFCIEYFVQIIDQLFQNGIKTIMCTPTPTPPIWISHNHPERMIMDESRLPMSHGGRQQVCTNNPYFRKRVAIIVEKIAHVYGDLEGVIGWQIDNELKGNVWECYCDSCKALWHQWLEKRYVSIEQLNKAWGTHIWSQHYETFEQVPQPSKTPMGHNPSLCTAYRLFSRDLVTEFAKEQVEIIKKYSKLPITHNSCLNHFIDNESMFENMDFAGFDHYSTSKDYGHMLHHLDTFKTLKKERPFWLMETAATFSGSSYGYQTIHSNGYLKAELAAAYALGAEGFNYWLWRQQRTGVEQTHGSVISSWGQPGVGFKNVVEAGHLKDRLEKVFSETEPVQAQLAVTYSDRARVFFMTEQLESRPFNYVEAMRDWYEMILGTGIYRDCIFEHHSFDGYKLLMTPYLPYISDTYFERAKSFVEAGGIWIVGPLSGTRTLEQTIHTDYALHQLEAFAGVETVFHYPITGSTALGKAFGEEAILSLWSSVFKCTEARAMGYIEEGCTPGLAFITECQRGKGKIVLLGSLPTGEQGNILLQKMLCHYGNEVGIQTPIGTKGSVVIPRKGQDFEQWVMINMDGKGDRLVVNTPCIDAFTGKTILDPEVTLEPYECRVIHLK